eukprot:CAMPEP_0168455530 /NCGR_PEP_ID=MMETSP0228-20121227/50799_1 /TAXON_ID=133427 /ORGANISM="Protoceratium reticulatum, Strain CCCM 535 (=CCMP 1889)" /LENGTH=88 /DNA_ID=CAMNT_0008470381 /DNA_START=10 /DNA_END=273 /DNA_ORIENTATION=+
MACSILGDLAARGDDIRNPSAYITRAVGESMAAQAPGGGAHAGKGGAMGFGRGDQDRWGRGMDSDWGKGMAPMMGGMMGGWDRGGWKG